MISIVVVVPTYNKYQYLELTLASLLRQTLGDFEVIVVNRGSTDATAEVLARWPDARVRSITQANGGRSAARNAGVAAARGAWVIFCDNDRLIAPDFVETHVRWFGGISGTS